tara:strand:- start:1800 stop:2489 length:690 start_codon:yes stop_codon:yes gene_type:complete
MVDFAAPNLCGASPDFNKLMNQFDTIKSEIVNGLDVDASTLANTLNTSLTQLETDLRAMVPSLPSLPAVNFQAEVASLATIPTGSLGYINKLAQLTTQFGSSLPDIEGAITSAIGAVTAGGDVCGGLPNLELPSGATEAVEKAKNSIQATAAALEEQAQSFSTDVSVDEVGALYGDQFSRDTLSSEITSLKSSLETAAKQFATKAEMLAAELSAAAAQARSAPEDQITL